jgi:flagellar secretion chaperone FliS
MDAQLAARNARYLEETVATAPPSKLLTLLYDRLVRDLDMGEKAIAADDRSSWVYAFDHAREILTELLTTLDAKVWGGAADLARIYSWMVSEIIAISIHGDATRVAPVRTMVEELRQAWHEAAAQLSPDASAFTS